MEQFAPAAKAGPQVFAKTNEEASAPVTVMLVKDKAAVPVLVRVTVFDPVDDPTVSSPNDRLVADRETAGAATPVPLSAIVCGEVEALSVMVMVAVRAPAIKGGKCR